MARNYTRKPEFKLPSDYQPKAKRSARPKKKKLLGVEGRHARYTKAADEILSQDLDKVKKRAALIDVAIKLGYLREKAVKMADKKIGNFVPSAFPYRL